MIKIDNLGTFVTGQDIQTLLIDASGVLYTDEGPVPGATDLIIKWQSEGRNCLVVTNNSGHDTNDIATRFQRNGVPFEPHHIISSGLGLAWDPEINSKINQKQVWVYGNRTSHTYVADAGGTPWAEASEDIECIVLTATEQVDHENKWQHLMSFVANHPQVPVICANPDHYVKAQWGRYNVIGYYANQIDQIDPGRVIWMGKPYTRFSDVLIDILEDRQVPINQGLMFFDDNPDNVIELQATLGATGCLVTETGISNLTPPQPKQTDRIQYCVAQFG